MIGSYPIGSYPIAAGPIPSSGGGGGSAFPVIFQQLGCAMNLLDIVKKDSVNRSVTVNIIDETTGLAETAVEHNTSGIALWYRREGATKATITPAALSALDNAHADGGIEHISDGAYRLDLPDAAYATGANYVDVGGVVTGMVVIGGRVRLVDYDPETDFSGGITSIIKNAFVAVELAISNASDQDALVLTGGPSSVLGNVLAILYDDSAAGVKEYIEGSFNGGTGVLVLNSLPSFTVTTDDTVTLLPLPGNDVNVASIDDDAISAGAVSAAAVTKVQNGLATPTNITGGVITTVTNLTNAPTSGDLTTTMKASVNAQVDTALADYDGPTNAEMVARTLAAADYATAGNLAATDTVVDATKVIADKLDTMMELDGSVYRLTTNSVEQVAAGSGTADWTADEKTAIRSILGIPGSGTTPADPSSGILDTIRDQTTSAVLEAAARAGVMGTWTDETGASFVLIITG
jgi:hypothetical protein